MLPPDRERHALKFSLPTIVGSRIGRTIKDSPVNGTSTTVFLATDGL